MAGEAGGEKKPYTFNDLKEFSQNNEIFSSVSASILVSEIRKD